jgi:hypothetical protein
VRPPLHVTEDPFLLELTLEDSQRFFDIVSKHLYFHENHPRSSRQPPDIFTTPQGGSCFIGKLLGNHIILPASSAESRNDLLLSGAAVWETRPAPFNSRMEGHFCPVSAIAGWKAVEKIQLLIYIEENLKPMYATYQTGK